MEDQMEQPADTQDSDAAANPAAEDSNSQGAENQYDDHGDADSQEQTAEDEEEVEIGDRKVALPKSLAEKLKSERMMQSDYTQKTQSVAEERKQVQAEREQIAQHREQAKQYMDELADLRSIDKQLEKINKFDLSEYVDSDPVFVLKVQEQRRALEAERATLAGNITQKQNDQALNEQQSLAKRVQDAEAYIGREIKGVTKERIEALGAYASSQGMDQKAISRAFIETPQVAVFMHKAELYDALMKKQSPKPPPVAAAKPAIRVGASASVQKDPSRMSDREFAQWRQSQIRNRK